jgi:CHAT domain-containing protein/tetratricopeptide (TPR) repeat protein
MGRPARIAIQIALGELLADILLVGAFPLLMLPQMTLRNLMALPLLLLSSVSYRQQLPTPNTGLNSAELYSALVNAEDRTIALALLKDQKQSITPFLWVRLIGEAVRTSNAGSNARALFVLEVAESVAEALEDKARVGYTYYRMAYVRSLQGDVKGAIDVTLISKGKFEEAGCPRDLVYVLSELGSLFILAGDYQKAEQYSETSLRISGALNGSEPTVSGLPREYGIACDWSNLGQVSVWKGDYNQAVARFEKSLELWEALNGKGMAYRAQIVDALSDIGIAYKMMGIHTQSLKYLYKALELAQTLKDKARLAGVYVSIGVLYIDQRDYSKAAGFLDQSFRLFAEADNKREVANTLINIGVMNQRQRKYAEAEQSFQDALRKADEIAAFDLVVAAQEGLGAVYYEEGKYDAALGWLDKGWSLAEKIGDKVRMMEIRWRKGQVFYSLREYAKADVNSGVAAELATKLHSPLLSYLALTLRGKIFRAQGVDDLAAECFSKAIEAAEFLRDQVAGGEREQEIFFEDELLPYHEMVSMLGQANHVEEALRYAERAKARVLLDVLRNGRIRVGNSLNQAQQAEERRLYSEMVSLNIQVRAERMREQPDEARSKEVEIRLQAARASYEAFQAALYATHPELRVKRGLFPSFAMGDAAALVSDTQTAVLEYVVTQEKVFLFMLTRDSTDPAKLKSEVRSVGIQRSRLSVLVEKYRNLLSTNHPGFRQSGVDLYDLLVKPVEPYLKGKDTLCIIPDGPLWNLPFQALQTPDEKYMLELYAIYYAPSLQVLHEMRKKSDSLRSSPLGGGDPRDDSGSSSGALSELYAVGNPLLGGEIPAQARSNAPFLPLPETEQEVQALADEVYGRQSSVVRTGAAAREATIKAEIGKYRVLHFATHGVLDDQNPLYSYIVLASSGNSQDDGRLEAWELMQMDLRAELVVLSACDTARGRVGDGEGVIGMTWAFFVAGVPTLVASQWQVPSKSTAKLMVAFHKNISGCRSSRASSKAEAWRRAALGMITDPRYRMKPYYWAGFVVVGDGGP